MVLIRYIGKHLGISLKMQDNNSAAAGFMLFKRLGDGYHALCLYDNNGIGDLPKGRQDPSDMGLFHTAQRECMEESSIIVTKNDLLSEQKLVLDERLVIYCALTEQQPEIRKNPISNKFEHQAYDWVSLKTLEKLLPNYLKPACPWAEMILNQYLTLQAQDY